MFVQMRVFVCLSKYGKASAPREISASVILDPQFHLIHNRAAERISVFLRRLVLGPVLNRLSPAHRGSVGLYKSEFLLLYQSASTFAGSKYFENASAPVELENDRIPSDLHFRERVAIFLILQQLRQYLYSCTSKASKLSTLYEPRLSAHQSCSAAHAFTRQYWYFCTNQQVLLY
jgi:hypothetical protein